MTPDQLLQEIKLCIAHGGMQLAHYHAQALAFGIDKGRIPSDPTWKETLHSLGWW